MSQQNYTVKELAELSGVSVRTLHYYDEIGLLVPNRDGSGYRVYGQKQVARLQKILTMRACALPLGEIKTLLGAADSDGKCALMVHLKRLQVQRNDINEAMRRTRDALSLMEGMEAMHAAWIQMHWADGTYSVEAHKALAQSYLADDRFRAYYDSAAGEGAIEFLVKALIANL